MNSMACLHTLSLIFSALGLLVAVLPVYTEIRYCLTNSTYTEQLAKMMTIIIIIIMIIITITDAYHHFLINFSFIRLFIQFIYYLSFNYYFYF